MTAAMSSGAYHPRSHGLTIAVSLVDDPDETKEKTVAASDHKSAVAQKKDPLDGDFRGALRTRTRTARPKACSFNYL
jgi:hypothetical protein